MHHCQHKWALWWPYTPSPPPNYNRLLRGLLPIYTMYRCRACSFGALGGHSASVGHGCDSGCVRFGACRSTNHFFTVKPWHIWYCWKALVSSKTILTLFWCHDVELKEKWRKCANFLLRLANYLRFLTILVSGFYAPVVLMPRPMVASF